MESEPRDGGFKDAFNETKSPSSATADLTAISESESIPEDDSSSGRNFPGQVSSSQIIGKQKRLIGKLRMEISVLEESLVAAQAKDVQLMQQQIEELHLDLRRLKHKNRELREKVDSLESVRWAQPKDELRQASVIIEREKSDRASTETVSASRRATSTTESQDQIVVTNEPSTLAEFIRTLSEHHQRLLRNHIVSEVESLRQADLKVIRELTTQLARAEKENRSPPAPREEFNEDVLGAAKHFTNTGTMTDQEVAATSRHNFSRLWFLVALMVALCSVVCVLWSKIFSSDWRYSMR